MNATQQATLDRIVTAAVAAREAAHARAEAAALGEVLPYTEDDLDAIADASRR